MPQRMVAVGVVLLGLFTWVIFRLHELQIVQNTQWVERGEKMLRQKQILTAMRGAIRDTNGELLAHNKRMYEVWVNTSHMRNPVEVRRRLAKAWERNLSELDTMMGAEEMVRMYRRHVSQVLAGLMGEPGLTEQQSSDHFDQMLEEEKRVEFRLVKELQEEDAAVWKKRLEDNYVSAITLRETSKRFYPCAERLTHVLGYVRQEQVKAADEEDVNRVRVKDVEIGTEGVEAAMDKALTGTDGYRWIERDRLGREIPAYEGKMMEPRFGQDVFLTIDMHLQEITEDVIDEAFEFHQPRRIVAVIVEPRTGAILSMASRPHFTRDSMEGTMSNLAVGAQYEPGSVFKIVAFAGALDRKLTSLEDTLDCDADAPGLGKIQLKDHVSGTISVAQALAQSSNRAAYLLAKRLGEERYMDYAKRFGFGQKTGIPLTGEVPGVVIPRNKWDSLTFSRMAIGHAVTVTPLQMAMGMAAIANGGSLMKPMIVKEVRDERGQVVQQFNPQVVSRVCSESAAAALRKGLAGVITNDKGTGKRASLGEITVAGKTGTSQRRKENGRGYEEGHYCVSFAGFAPAENPQLCAIVVVDDPKGNPSDLMGGKLAAPIFAQLMKQCLTNIAVAHDTPALREAFMKGGVE